MKTLRFKIKNQASMGLVSDMGYLKLFFQCFRGFENCLFQTFFVGNDFV